MKSILSLAVLLLVGCASNEPGHASVRIAPPTPDADRAALLDRVKSLEGTWESKGPEGTHVSSVFAVTSNGSAVRELMLPGTPQEMTNMYTMEGPTLVMTHYCAMGNQPHMRAKAEPHSKTIHFDSDGVSNLQKDHAGYMGSMALTIIDNDHIKADWSYNQEGQEPATSTFEMTRKK